MPPLDIKPLDIQPLTAQQEEPSMLSKLWSGVSEPLTTAPSRFARSVSDWLTTPELDDSQLGAMAKGFAGGATEGLGNIADSLTSPLSLATLGLGGTEFAAGKAGLPQIARLANIGTRVASAPVALHGAGEVLNPEATMGQRAMGLTELAGGLAGTMHGPPMGKMDLNEPLVKSPVKPPVKPLDVTDSIQILDDTMNNASGESAASVEALNRQKGMKAKGQQYVVYDKAGNKRPLIGPDAVDYVAKKGETYGIESPDGFQLLDDKGGKVPPTGKTGALDIEPMPEGFFDKMAPEQAYEGIVIPKEQASPEYVKRAKAGGYEFDGLDDQGNFRFKKSGKPAEVQPILESEVGQQRPTRAGETQQLGPLTDVKKSNPVVEAFNLPRGIMASMDFSAPLRQGIGLIHKKEFWNALGPMFKSWANEDAFRASQQAIAERPLFRTRLGKNGKELPSFAADAGLQLTDLTSLSKREEALMSTWAEKIPGVRPSNRAYTAFLNNLRADTFESLIKSGQVFGADAKANIPLARALADFVNTATGRGSLGKLEKAAVPLNTVLFSPRLIASRVKMLNPMYYLQAPPQVRKEALKSLFAIATAGNVVTQLGKMAGGEVSMDPSSSDFGKLKIGNTRIDPYAGFQQYIVLANRLLSGKVTSSTSGKQYDLTNPKGPFDPTHKELLERFTRGKLHPVLGFAWSLLDKQREMSGKPMNFSTPNPMENAIAQRFIPIVMQDMYEISKENPDLLPIAGPLSTFGMGVQSYAQ